MVKKVKMIKNIRKLTYPKQLENNVGLLLWEKNIKQNVMLAGVKMKLTYLISM